MLDGDTATVIVTAFVEYLDTSPHTFLCKEKIEGKESSSKTAILGFICLPKCLFASLFLHIKLHIIILYLMFTYFFAH